MKHIVKPVRKVLKVVALLVVLCLIIIFLYNRIMLIKEKPFLEDHPGQMVDVDGHKMCVYTEGDGDETIVFLSGSGTASPILDFKPLYQQLSDTYRIVVIEKFGYGFSDITEDERSFDTILRQDREALNKLGIEGPFVLCPHSMSGLEALLWAQNYPEEVQAIVGLDMSLPEAYDQMNFKQVQMMEKLGIAARELGLVRLFYQDSNLSPGLSAEDKKLYRAIASRIAVNRDVQHEGMAISQACEEIKQAPLPNVPTLQFVSNGKDVGVEDWITIHRKYADQMKDATLIQLDCDHYVHDYQYEKIAKEMETFVQRSFG